MAARMIDAFGNLTPIPHPEIDLGRGILVRTVSALDIRVNFNRSDLQQAVHFRVRQRLLFKICNAYGAFRRRDRNSVRQAEFCRDLRWRVPLQLPRLGEELATHAIGTNPNTRDVDWLHMLRLAQLQCRKNCRMHALTTRIRLITQFPAHKILSKIEKEQVHVMHWLEGAIKPVPPKKYFVRTV